MNEQIKDKKEKLGFTSNSSTQHAIFIVREMCEYVVLTLLKPSIEYGETTYYIS